MSCGNASISTYCCPLSLVAQMPSSKKQRYIPKYRQWLMVLFELVDGQGFKQIILEDFWKKKGIGGKYFDWAFRTDIECEDAFLSGYCSWKPSCLDNCLSGRRIIYSMKSLSLFPSQPSVSSMASWSNV